MQQMSLAIGLMCMVGMASADTLTVPAWTTGMTPSPMTASVGDTIEFTFAASHNVQKMGSMACDFEGNVLSGEGATTYTYTVDAADAAAGVIFFGCSIGTHCSSGNMKQQVTVQTYDHNYPSVCPELEGSYEATLAELSDSGVVGKVTVHRQRDATSGVLHLAVGGYATGLTDGADCDACSEGNCCGFHIHAGESCVDNGAQGGHLKNTNDLDPWADIKISTASQSAGEQMFARLVEVNEDYPAFEGKVFIVHDENGTRVSCGPLVRVATTAYKTSSITRFSSTTSEDPAITGSAEVQVGTFAALTCVRLDGYPVGTSCDDGAKCGVHVHSGTSCADAAAQGGHYPATPADPSLVVLPTQPKTDPWHNNVLTLESMTGSDDMGWGVIMTGSEYTDVEGKAFVVHDQSGNARASCGVLEVQGDEDGTTTSGSATLWSGLAVTAATLIAYFAG